MGKKKKELGFDSDGAKKVMRKRDYMADMSGQLALGLMANVVGQLTYFYTDDVPHDDSGGSNYIFDVYSAERSDNRNDLCTCD